MYICIYIHVFVLYVWGVGEGYATCDSDMCGKCAFPIPGVSQVQKYPVIKECVYTNCIRNPQALKPYKPLEDPRSLDPFITLH